MIEDSPKLNRLPSLLSADNGWQTVDVWATSPDAGAAVVHTSMHEYESVCERTNSMRTSAFIGEAKTFENLSAPWQHLSSWVKQQTRAQWMWRQRGTDREPMTCSFGSLSLRKCQPSTRPVPCKENVSLAGVFCECLDGWLTLHL